MRSGCRPSQCMQQFMENWRRFWTFAASIFCLQCCISEKPPEVSDRMTAKRKERPTVPSEELLPGIPNDITVKHIIPRLSLLPPVLSSPLLSLVSGGWRRAIHSEEVYAVSTLLHSMETFVAIDCNLGDKPRVQDNRIALYSMTDRNLYPLPLIPCDSGAIPFPNKCVSLDGKLYLLGGCGDLFMGIGDDDLEREWPPYMSEMYVLDMAQIPLKWTECAEMWGERKDFGCGVKDGKIYIFGGNNNYSDSMCESEVYDPEKNCWSPISPMKSERAGHQVATIGEELVVYGGLAYGREDGDHEVYQLEFYHPGSDEWRVVKPFGMEGFCRMFHEQGKFYAMTLTGIFVHHDNIEENSWRELHSFSLSGASGCSVWCTDGDNFNDLCPVLVVDGELLTAFYGHLGDATGEPEVHFVQSKGFGSENKDLLWEKAKCNRSLSFVRGAPLLCPVKL